AKNCKNAKGEKLDHLCQKALEGFAFILSPEGDIVYLTENVTKYLGLQQIELMGQSVYEFTHPCDHDEIKEILTNKQASQQKSSSQPENKIFFLRMKCTLTAKGRNVNLKSATFKVMRCTGRLVTKEADIVDLTLENSCPAVPYLVGIAEPIPHPVNIEVPLDSKTFLSKHSMDMHFTFCDERLVGVSSSPSFVQVCCFLFLVFAKGQTMTGAYRFLAKEGGYIWVITQATIINNSRTQKPQWVVCVHYVLSCIEEKGAILSHVQHNSEAKAKQADVLPAKLELTTENMFMPQKVELSTENIFMPPKVELSTENIFIPKTKEMDTGYFIPPELKSTMTFINDEPEDLSYLAPNPGDESVPLIFTYGRDDAIIPSPSDYLSFAVPGDVEAMDQFFQSIKAGDNDQDVEEIDFDMRAPYIPMDAEEDLGLLPPSSNVLFNLTSDINPGLFGQTESVFEPKHSLFDEVPQPPKQSVRDMLSGSTTVASIEQPPDTMYLQLKRPLDMNSLENGPPRNKVSRLEPGSLVVQTDSLPVTGSETRLINKDSVLLNLLLRGEDRVYGYKVNNMSGNNKNNHLGLLPNLTSHDCEVNAPIAANHLLQGSELLHALEALTSSKLAPKVIRPHL
uniref:PAS domain-containing protein n=1 Tax=Biomphalaria glabrata TaxID=6526 RepID=A0A2C9KF36_BIOGL